LEAPVVATSDQAGALLDRHLAGDRTAFQPSDELTQFYRDLRSVVPELDALGDPTDRLITLNLLWGTDDAILSGITRLVVEHGLVLYDPQTDQVHPPDASGTPFSLPANVANPAWWRRIFGSSR